jgi:hypothetical protein
MAAAAARFLIAQVEAAAACRQTTAAVTGRARAPRQTAQVNFAPVGGG